MCVCVRARVRVHVCFVCACGVVQGFECVKRELVCAVAGPSQGCVCVWVCVCVLEFVQYYFWHVGVCANFKRVSVLVRMWV